MCIYVCIYACTNIYVYKNRFHLNKAMSGLLIVLMGFLSLSSLQRYSYKSDTPYYSFPKFWTNTGLCPAGRVIHEEIENFLVSDAMQMNLLYISALPRGSITHIRIHWLLELLQFQQFTQSGVPIFDFSVLDKFMMDLDEKNLSPVMEFMANLSNLFIKNPDQNNFYWENLSYQVAKHYLNFFGAKKVLNWRFETWNEPDVLTYNKLNFTVEDYVNYIQSLYVGLEIAGSRPVDSLHFPLRGPAGLFKSLSHHKLCWSILDFCNKHLEGCPLTILTYHRKGYGENASDVIINSKLLLTQIYEKYPNLKMLPISNDESDPIAGWSTPRDFQADVRYAITLVCIILEHWSAKLTDSKFANLETISHDNAFLSYHPNEFSQRTLLAHFRMNNTSPPHSQFIQKPVYTALGLLSRLADMASDVLTLETSSAEQLILLKTIASGNHPLYHSWLIMSISSALQHEKVYVNLPRIKRYDNEYYAFIVEAIDQAHTNPANVWFGFNSPPYPNSIIREAMRRQQGPRVLTTGVLNNTNFSIDLSTLTTPWLLLFRICSNLKTRLSTPQKLLITPVTYNEVHIKWQEIDAASVQCLKTYQVWYKFNNTQSWICISLDWHLPFPSFHFAPSNGLHVNGFYKVRGTDIFNNTSLFSTQVQYIEII